MARASIIGATIFASITSSTAVVGLDPAELPTVEQGTTVATRSSNTTTPGTSAPSAAAPSFDTGCSEFLADYCVEIPIRGGTAHEEVSGCRTAADDSPTGTTEIVPAPTPPTAGSFRVRIEIETGLAVDPDCFAGEVLDILNDDRGWSDTYDTGFTQVDGNEYDLRLVLASPPTTDALCYPARTVGIYSCRKESRVVINLMRWETGTEEYSSDLTTYRQYLVNHEVGHFLGRGHLQCPAPGEPAPVMMQQTKGLDGCLANGWPTGDEL